MMPLAPLHQTYNIDLASWVFVERTAARMHVFDYYLRYQSWLHPNWRPCWQTTTLGAVVICSSQTEATNCKKLNHKALLEDNLIEGQLPSNSQTFFRTALMLHSTIKELNTKLWLYFTKRNFEWSALKFSKNWQKWTDLRTVSFHLLWHSS